MASRITQYAICLAFLPTGNCEGTVAAFRRFKSIYKAQHLPVMLSLHVNNWLDAQAIAQELISCDLSVLVDVLFHAMTEAACESPFGATTNEASNDSSCAHRFV